MTASFEDAENKFLTTSVLRYPYHYTSGGDVVAEKLLVAFSSSDYWAGSGGITGAKERLTKSLATTKLAIGTTPATSSYPHNAFSSWLGYSNHHV